MDLITRYKNALVRLADDKPMMRAKETGVSTPECRARIIYAKRVLENLNGIEAIESGVIAEMEMQTSTSPQVTEVLVGEHPVGKD